MGVGLGDGKKEMFSGDSLSRELGKTVVKVTEFFFFSFKEGFFLVIKVVHALDSLL